jgi:hypothetical protein
LEYLGKLKASSKFSLIRAKILVFIKKFPY